MTVHKSTKDSNATTAAKALTGAKKHFTNGSEMLPLAGGGRPTTVTDLETALALISSLRADTLSAQATAHARVEAERLQAPALIALLRAFLAYVKLTLGASAEALADFGLPPPKARTPMTAVAKAAAAAKRKATREARGTKSPKQKKGIHGNVTVDVVVTPVNPAPAEVPAAPAPAAAPTTKA